MLSITVALLAPCGVQGQVLNLENLVVSTQGQRLAAEFSIYFDDHEEIERLLQGGVTLALTTDIDLLQKREFWFDKEIFDTEVYSTLYADALTREYILAKPDGVVVRDGSLDSIIEKHMRNIIVEMGAVDVLEKGVTYFVKLEVSLTLDNVPEWMRGALFFWQWDVAPTVSYSMSFVY